MILSDYKKFFSSVYSGQFTFSTTDAEYYHKILGIDDFVKRVEYAGGEVYEDEQEDYELD